MQRPENIHWNNFCENYFGYCLQKEHFEDFQNNVCKEKIICGFL